MHCIPLMSCLEVADVLNQVQTMGGGSGEQSTVELSLASDLN